MTKLFNKLCPVCKKDTKKEVHSKQNRKILDTDGVIDVFQVKYHCLKCGRYFTVCEKAPLGSLYSWRFIKVVLHLINDKRSYEAIRLRIKEMYMVHLAESTICDMKKKYWKLYKKGVL